MAEITQIPAIPPNEGLIKDGNAHSTGYRYANITTDTTTEVKSSPGFLHTLTFNAPTATEVVTLYDNTAGSGSKIGTITIPASPMPVTLTYDAYFSVGLTIVTATATSDITVTYI